MEKLDKIGKKEKKKKKKKKTLVKRYITLLIVKERWYRQ